MISQNKGAKKILLLMGNIARVCLCVCVSVCVCMCVCEIEREKDDAKERKK